MGFIQFVNDLPVFTILHYDEILENGIFSYNNLEIFTFDCKYSDASLACSFTLNK